VSAASPIHALCEACEIEPGRTVVLEHEKDFPYVLCPECEQRLGHRSLRPREWFNLAARYTTFRFELHDDFYDEETGEALQAEEPVVGAVRFPIPEAADAGDAKRLVDFAFARTRLSAELVARLRECDPASVVREIARRAEHGALPLVDKCFEIVADAVGPPAAEWIRRQWRERSSTAKPFHPLARASAACLPFEEGYSLVRGAIEPLPWMHLREALPALGYFNTERTLDWIEGKIDSTKPTLDRWGHLAASSRLSWPRVDAWLDRGRPLSLVALDAMLRCLRPLRPGETRIYRLFDPAPPDVMIGRLRGYASTDPVPRVDNAIAAIIALLSGNDGGSRSDC
jgi:hypothetical protein